MKQIQSYTYDVPAGGAIAIPATNDNFYINAATGPITVRGDTFGSLKGLIAGQGLKDVPFGRLEVVNEGGAVNTVTILLTPAEFVNQVFSGSVTIVGGVLTDTQLRASPVIVADRPELVTSTWTNAALWGAANSSVNVFTAGANVNGAIVWAAGANDQSASGAPQSFVAKATAPANILDGDVIAMTRNQVLSATPLFYKELDLIHPQRIAAGLGLWFISAFAGSAAGNRFCRYQLL